MTPNLKAPETSTADISSSIIEHTDITMPPSKEDYILTDNEEDIIENLGPTIGGVGSFTNPARRVSRASLTFFQKQTSSRSFAPEKSLIGQDGKLQDDYILKRQSVNKPATLKKIPLLADLTTDITQIDGWVVTQLFLSGYARMASKVDELNKINVFPIADGDTGANMKVCLKLPTRNLLLFPDDSLIKTTSNLAADVLLNGQGNSGTILSHFFVSLAEETKDINKESLSITEFANLLSKTGMKMDTAVPNPVEGTLLSVCRDACQFNSNELGDKATLKDLLEAWNTKAQTELKATPEKLVVDGVKVLEKAGVVDSGAAGFVYLVEGMYMASKGELPEATNPELFMPAKGKSSETDELPILDNHHICDSKYQYCTETVILLKDGVTKDQVLSTVTGDDADEYGDSVVCVSGPSKCGRGINMCKLHIHSNHPQKVFDRVREFSREPELKKEKVEDMWIMRDNMHGGGGGAEEEPDDGTKNNEEEGLVDFSDAKFSILGLSSVVLPPQYYTDELGTIPIFVVPASTQEPIDMRHCSETELIQALNGQRHKETATRYTTAAANPMQIKIELLAMLQKGKPVLVFVFSVDKRVSALGRNMMQAIEMLEPEQQAMVKVLVHGWGTHEGQFIKEAMDLARRGKSIDEAYEIVQEFADRRFFFVSVLSSRSVGGLFAWRPMLFPKDFKVEQGSFYSFGQPPKIREGEPWPDMRRAAGLLNMMGKGSDCADLIDAEIQRIKDTLQPDQKIEKCWISCVGRPDKGKEFVEKLKAANVPLVEEPVIFGTNMLALTMSSWGEFTVMYKVI